MNLQKGTHNTSQPRGQFNNPRLQTVQVSRQEEYIRQGTGYSQQAVSNHTGLYVSPAGGVAGGPGPQQAPPPQQAVGMPGTATAHPNPQAAAPQQTGQMQQQRGQGMFYRQQNIVRGPYANMGWSHNTLNLTNSAPQVNAQSFPASAVPSLAYLQPGTYSLPQAATIMRGPPVPNYQFPSPPATGQYNLPSQQVYMAAGNANYNPYGTQRLIYSQMPTQVLTQMPSNRNTMPTLPPQQVSQQPLPSTAQREKKLIRIQDPKTMQDVVFDKQEFSEHTVPDPSLSKESSLTETVPIQFAKQVAAVAISMPSRKEPHKQECLLTPQGHPIISPILPVSINQGMLVPPPVPPEVLLGETADRVNVVMGLDPRTEVVSNEELEEVHEYELGTPVPPHEILDSHVIDSVDGLEAEEQYLTEDCAEEIQFQAKVSDDFHMDDTCDSVVEEQVLQPVGRTRSPSPIYQEEDVDATTLGVHSSTVGVHSSSVGVHSSSVGVHSSTVGVHSSSVGVHSSSVGVHSSTVGVHSSTVGVHSSTVGVHSAVAVTPVTPQSLPVEIEASVDQAQQQPLPASLPSAPVTTLPRDSTPPPSVPPPAPEIETVVQEEKRPEVQSKPQQNGDLSPVSYDSKEASEGRDNKKKGKKKQRDLNMKGEGKEGSEMDAFVVDRHEESSTNQAPPVVSSKVVLSSVDRETEDEELRKVAEKNQENARVSNQEEDVSTTPVIEAPQPQVKSQGLKYAYKEDQWSPLNPEGKKHYDRAFLLTMQSQPMSLQKPAGLPNLEVIKDIATQFKLRDHSSRPVQPPMQARGNLPDFTPSYAYSNTQRPPQGGGNRRPSQQSRDKPKKIINISTSLTEDVKLHSSENAWKPTYKAAPESDTEEEAKTNDLYKKVRGILNKLTPQKFQTLVEQVRDMPIDTEERLKGVIDLVFEKAVDEPNFSVPYANMCKHLAMKAVPSGQNNQNVNFRKLLLTKCQKEFESDSKDEIKKAERLKEISLADPDKRKQLTEELEEDLRKSRIRSLGNIKFIGELYKLHMLVTPIMHDCLKKLLQAADEDSLECLCRLLTTVGKEVESEKKNESSEKRNHNKVMMDAYFEGLKKFVESRNTSSRVRFMIQDVIELRLNNWVPRRIENNPKTIDQIHMEAEREAHEQHLMTQQPLPPSAGKRPDDRDRRKNRSMQGGGGFDEGGWNTVGSNKGRSSASFNYDPSKGTPKLSSKPLETDSIQLGPSNRTWSRGSSGGGTRPASQEDSKTNMPTNRFQALASQDSEPRRTLHQSSSSSREPSRGRGSQGGGGPPMTLRKTPSQSNQNSLEREKATAMVKSFFEPSNLEHPTPSSRNSVAAEPSKESPEHKEVAPTVAPAVPPVPVESTTKSQAAPGEYQLLGRDLNQDEMAKHATPILDEYLHNNDLKEAIQCIVELASPTTIDTFVSVSVNYVLERSNKARIGLGHLLRELLSKRILNQNQLFQGLESIFESVMDLEIDIPKVYQYLAEILLPLVQDGSLTLAQLRKAITICIQQNCGGKMFSNLLHVMTEHLGHKKIKELWEKSGLDWADILGPDEDPTQFVIANKLEFTTTGAPAAPGSEFSMGQLKEGLDALLKKASSNEAIFDWIEAKLSGDRLSHPIFIRALVTSITESAIEGGNPEKLDPKKLKDRIVVLTKYIDSNEDLELQALYALQALDNRLQHPKGLLVHIFEVLYDEDVISEDAFSQWENSTDQAESEGKGVALKSVTSFFTWLKEADLESGEEN